jgi:hypothetical protein
MSPEIIDLIIRGRKCDDPDVLDEVEEAWEELSEKTRAYVASIQDRFPPGLKRIVDSYYLHDADVLGVGISEGQIVFYLRLGTPPQSLLTFRYGLIEAPRINREALPEALRDRSVVKQWDQDEIELVEGDPPTWRQSILLSNGWMIDLHFRDVHVEEIPALLPEPRKSTLSAPDDLPKTA